MISLLDILYNSFFLAPFYILVLYYFLYRRNFYLSLIVVNGAFIINKIVYITGNYSNTFYYLLLDLLIINFFIYLFIRFNGDKKDVLSLKKFFIFKTFIDSSYFFIKQFIHVSDIFTFSYYYFGILFLISIIFFFYAIKRTIKQLYLYSTLMLFIIIHFLANYLVLSTFISFYKVLTVISFLFLSILYFFLFFLEQEKLSKEIKNLNTRLDIVNVFVKILSIVSEYPIGYDNLKKSLKDLNNKILKIINQIFGWASSAIYILEENNGKIIIKNYGFEGDFKPLNIHSETFLSVMRIDQKIQEIENHEFTTDEPFFKEILNHFEHNSIKYIEFKRPKDNEKMKELGLTEYISEIAAIPLKKENKIFGLIIFQDKKQIKDIAYDVFIEDYSRISELYSMILNNIFNNANLIKEHERTKIVKQELEIASQLQQSLLPNDIPQISGLQLTGFMQPAREIGGDYYDFIKIDENKIAIMIGDISGKGLPAGMLMLVIRTIIHTIIRTHYKPKEVISFLSSVLTKQLESGKFVTFLYLLWDNTQKKIFYTACGHEHILHYSKKNKTLNVIKSGGIALGIIEDLSPYLEEKELILEPGDIIILYTDGITEARNLKQEFYTLERLQNKLTRLLNTLNMLNELNVERIKNEIIKDIKNFSEDAPQYDDMTLVIIQREEE